MNLATAYTYPLVKANKALSVYRTSNIQSNGVCLLSNPILSFKVGETIGVIAKVYEMPKGDHVAYIQLFEPIKSGIYSYSHAMQFISNVDEIKSLGDGSVGKTYFCTGDNVNIRKSASTTASKFKNQLSKGDIIGTSDGTLSNGFLKFNLKIGGTGYVSKTYCTLQSPAKAVTKSATITDSLTGQTQSVNIPVITDPIKSFDVVRTVIGGVIAFSVTFALTKIVNSFSKK